MIMVACPRSDYLMELKPFIELEQQISEFLGTEDTILYTSCFDANGGLFETLLTNEDAIISDELNHASIIDGVRLSKASRYRYKNNDMADLEAKLQEASSARFKMIATDGVFSMDGYIANLAEVCNLAEKYDALVMVDDSHAVGFMGKLGKGTHEHCGVIDKIDVITGTGRALGCVGRIYERQRMSRTVAAAFAAYLFSIRLPADSGSIHSAIDLLTSTELTRQTMDNTRYFRKKFAAIGLEVLPGEHPIVHNVRRGSTRRKC